jgi:hypothetical protein
MGTLIKQECFKLFKKKSTFIAPIVFILLMVAQGYIATKYNEILGAIKVDFFLNNLKHSCLIKVPILCLILLFYDV